VQCWLIQYGASERIAHAVKDVVAGENAVDFVGVFGARSFRIAIRFSG
jgi:hypothetical protein